MDFNNFKRAYNTLIVGLCGFFTLYAQNFLQNKQWFIDLHIDRETTYLILSCVIILIYIISGLLINLISYPKIIRSIFDKNASIMGSWIDTITDGNRITHGAFFINYSPLKSRYVVKGYGYIGRGEGNDKWILNHEWTSFAIDIEQDFNRVRYMFKINDMNDLSALYFGACYLIFQEEAGRGSGFFVTEKHKNETAGSLAIRRTVFEKVDRVVMKECLPDGILYLWGLNPKLKTIINSESFISEYHKKRGNIMINRLNMHSNI